MSDIPNLGRNCKSQPTLLAFGSNSVASPRMSPFEKAPPTSDQIEAAKKRWHRDYGITPEVLELNIARTRPESVRRLGHDISPDLIVALLMRAEHARPRFRPLRTLPFHFPSRGGVMRNLRKNAGILTSKNVSVIPIKADNSKQPVVASKKYQSRIASPPELDRWFQRDNEVGVALVCGKISGGMEGIDIDRHACMLQCEKFAPALLERLPMGQTPGVAVFSENALGTLPREDYKRILVCCNPSYVTETRLVRVAYDLEMTDEDYENQNAWFDMTVVVIAKAVI